MNCKIGTKTPSVNSDNGHGDYSSLVDWMTHWRENVLPEHGLAVDVQAFSGKAQQGMMGVNCMDCLWHLSHDE
jgi:hypothetical protein